MMQRSAALLERARHSIPGGVNSPVRSFNGVGGTPRFIERAEGPYLYDADGNRYIDLMNSWGPMILGHGHPGVLEAIRHQVGRGLSFGAPTEQEIQLAEQIVGMVPSVEMVRLTSSGTEACMTAIRLARGITGRSRIVKAAGCYHGHADPFLVAAGSGLLTLGIATSAGVTAGAAADTIVVPFNNSDSLHQALAGGDVAAVILEPVAGNMGCIPPRSGYLEAVRDACTRHGTLLIFDEVMTGFRLSPGGAQELFNVTADIVTYGKVIGGGMPIGAVAGSRSIMEHLAPLGSVYQAGTLSGNPLAVTCGLVTLRTLASAPCHYECINSTAHQLAEGLRSIAHQFNLPCAINHIGSMLSVHFDIQEVYDLESAQRANATMYSAFFHSMLEEGIMLPPSAFESWFISTSITDEHLEEVLSAARRMAEISYT